MLLAYAWFGLDWISHVFGLNGSSMVDLANLRLPWIWVFGYRLLDEGWDDDGG